MPDWDNYPPDYRAAEVQRLLASVAAGECVSVIGLSGAGKSNLLGFLANRQSLAAHRLILVDTNRLPVFTLPAALKLIRRALAPDWGYRGLADSSVADPDSELDALDSVVSRQLESGPLTLLLDLSLLDRSGLLAGASTHALFNNLRALRDVHKFQLTFVTASRHPLPPDTEFAELIHAHILWLGCLSESDARWNVKRYADRKGLAWDETVTHSLIQLSRGYPSLLKAACEAYAVHPDLDSLASHPAVQNRVAEFWADQPTPSELRSAGLSDHPLLTAHHAPDFDATQLTAKEHLLLNYFLTHPDTVCEKDDLIRAVWPEDKVFERGVRDDSLAQLVRRLREKIEPDPAKPKHIHTVPGRGYRFKRD